MPALRRIEIEVEEATAAALSDHRRRAAVGRLVDRMVSPGAAEPLMAALEKTASLAREAGFSDADLDVELAAYNAERRD